MTEQTTEPDNFPVATDEQDEHEQDALAEEPAEEHEVPLVENCEINFSINVAGVHNLTEAINVAAIQLMRFGLDAFYLEATDTDTDTTYIIHNGNVMSFDDVEADFEEAKAELNARLEATEDDDR